MTAPASRPQPVERAAPGRVRFFSPTMRRLAGFFWALAVILLPVAALTRGAPAVLFALGPSVFLAAFAWFVLWRPHLECTPDALVIADVRRTTSIAWRRVQAVRDRYGIAILTSEGVRRTWVAPGASSRLATSDGPLTVQAAAERIRSYVPEAEQTDGPPPSSVTAAPIATRVHGWTIALLIVLGILASMLGARI